jgi:hypothetical protein
MISKQTGNTLVAGLVIKDDQGLAYVPDNLQVSILKSDGSEDTLTFGGATIGDNWIVADASPGVFTVFYKIALSAPTGIWYVNAHWTTTFLGETIEVSLEEPVPFRVTPNPSKWLDS